MYPKAVKRTAVHAQFDGAAAESALLWAVQRHQRISSPTPNTAMQPAATDLARGLEVIDPGWSLTSCRFGYGRNSVWSQSSTLFDHEIGIHRQSG